MPEQFTLPPRRDPRFIDLTGRKFNRLSVLRFLGKNANKTPCWLCRCECGRETIVAASNLARGHTKSCGCILADKNRQRATHSATSTSEYGIWNLLKNRCHNPNADNYRFYGGRGIKVCERWRTSFASFLEDIGPRPSLKHQIERKNNDGDYTPENCQWATRTVQARNTRRNRFEEFNGIVMCLSAWTELLGVSEYIFKNRARNGHTFQDTVRDILKKKREAVGHHV